jgi:hypothetical protein
MTAWMGGAAPREDAVTGGGVMPEGTEGAGAERPEVREGDGGEDRVRPVQREGRIALLGQRRRLGR